MSFSVEAAGLALIAVGCVYIATAAGLCVWWKEGDR